MFFSLNYQPDDFSQLSTLNSQLSTLNYHLSLSSRRDGDSNPGNTFGVYTLSRRASSTTRASLLRALQRLFIKIGYKGTAFFLNMQIFCKKKIKKCRFCEKPALFFALNADF